MPSKLSTPTLLHRESPVHSSLGWHCPACRSPCPCVHVTLSVFSDLALRNCFLTSDLNVKVGDYGIGFSRYKVSQGLKILSWSWFNFIVMRWSYHRTPLWFWKRGTNLGYVAFFGEWFVLVILTEALACVVCLHQWLCAEVLWQLSKGFV